jgi:2-polyprenyl-3-methyl-5-hydroxy-6-metoxy-1,4-benzoquinol methylase
LGFVHTMFSKRTKNILKQIIPASIINLYRRYATRRYHRYVNPLLHPAETYYFERYYEFMQLYLHEGDRILDTACHSGRFTVRLIDKGYRVTCTDWYANLVEYTRKAVHLPELLEGAYTEGLTDTVKRTEWAGRFNMVLGVEVLHAVPEYEEVIEGLGKMLAPNGVLVTTHRAPAFYVYRYLKEKKYEELEMLLAGKHPMYNVQHPDELEPMYARLGLKIVQKIAIGPFSGYLGDPWAHFANAAKLKGDDLKELIRLEQNPQLQHTYLANGRFMLVFSQRA